MKKIPKSLRKYIRLEKARIHRDISNSKEQEKLIGELYQKFLKPHADTGNLQPGDK